MSTASAIAYLRSPLAIRARCEAIFEAALAGQLEHFRVEIEALQVVIDEVVRVTREQYPQLRIPVHGRINHFRAGGIDRVAALDARLPGTPEDKTRAWIDLITVSVLLDAGAGERVAAGVRERLGVPPLQLPLACVLEGGTWAAGRAVANRLRPGGAPPIRIESDGTVF